MRFTKAMAMLVGTFLVAITQVLASPAPIPGYKIVPVTWTIPNGTYGDFLKLQGTYQEVEAQLARDHAHIKRDVYWSNGTSSDVSVAEISSPRGTPSQDWHDHATCYEPGKAPGHSDWARANAYYILQGVDYLNGFKHPIGVDGPNACGRVSCSYNSAIFMCNDHPLYLEFENGKPLANAASRINNDDCSVSNGPGWRDLHVLGQLFSDDNSRGEKGVNVVVRWDKC